MSRINVIMVNNYFFIHFCKQLIIPYPQVNGLTYRPEKNSKILRKSKIK